MSKKIKSMKKEETKIRKTEDSEETQSNQREKVGDENDLSLDELMAGEREVTNKEIATIIQKIEGGSNAKFSSASIIKVDRYLSESEEIRKNIVLAKALLIIAGTGVGKTKGTIDALRSENKPFIFLVPNRANKDQMSREYNISRTIWEGKRDKRNISLYDLLEEGVKEIVCCYETFKNYLKEKGTYYLNVLGFYLVIDEIHKIITDLHYRENLSVINNDIEHKIFLTATPHLLNENAFDNAIRVELSERRVLRPIVNTIEIPDAKNWTDWKYKKAIDGIKADHKGEKILHVCTYMKEKEVNLGLEAGTIINRKNIDEKEEYKAIIEQSMLTKDYMISTNLFSAGVNIVNEEKCVLIIDLEGKNISETEITQITGRFRRATSLTVYFICRGNRRSEISFDSYKRSVLNKVNLLNSKIISYDNLEIMHPMLSKAISRDQDGLYDTSDELIHMVIENENLARQKTLDEVAIYCCENGIKVNERIIIDVKAPEGEKKGRGRVSKKHLKEIFIDMIEGEYVIPEAVIEYFDWRVIIKRASKEEKKELETKMKDSLKREYHSFYMKLKEKKSPGSKIPDAITRLVDKIANQEGGNIKECIKEVLFDHFSLVSKYSKNGDLIEKKEEALEYFHNLEDSRKMTKTKKWLYTNIKSMDKDADKLLDTKSLTTKIREILKALGIKDKRKGGRIVFELI